MSVTIESDLKDILNKFDQKLDKLDAKIDKLSQDVSSKIDKLSQEINDVKVSTARLEEKVEGINKRIDTQEFVNRGILIGLVVTIIGGAAKLFGFVGNP